MCAGGLLGKLEDLAVYDRGAHVGVEVSLTSDNE
jgi:hypothetical protein